MWGLGSLNAPPAIAIYHREDGPLMLKLQSVGSIEALIFRQQRMSYEDQFLYIADFVLACKHSSSAAGFVSAMERIYAVPPAMRSINGVLFELSDFISVIPDFVSKFENLSAEFQEQNSLDDRRLVAKKLIELLRLSTPCIRGGGRYTRLEWFTIPTCLDYETCIATVRCHSCGQCSPFSLQTLGRPSDVAEVYRIPGVQYEQTLKNGVGIVVSRNLIIGRMIYGTPACLCFKIVDVELK